MDHDTVRRPKPRPQRRSSRNTRGTPRIVFSRALAGVCALLLGAPAFASLAPAADSLALRGGTVLNPSGERIENAVVLIVDGMIQAVGPDVEIPYDAKVLDVDGKILFPGMVLAQTSDPLDRANENVPVAPFLDVYDALDPNDVSFEENLRNGITTVHVMQGNETVVAGVGRIVRPFGLMVDEMTVRPATALKMSISPRSGFNRMTQMAELRKAFTDLDEHVKQTAERLYEEGQKKKGEKVLLPPDEAAAKGMESLEVSDLDPRWQTFYRLSKGEVAIFLNCDTAADALRGIEFMTEKGLLEKVTFVLGTETYKVAAQIAATGRPAILSPNLVHRERNPDTGKVVETFVPKVLHDAGIRFALQQGGGAMGEGFLWYQAAMLVREGLGEDVALAAVTQTAADVIGLGDLCGSIAPGKFGNVAVLSGAPLDQQSHVETTVVEGKVVYERSKDRRLKEVLSGEQQTSTDATSGN